MNMQEIVNESGFLLEQIYDEYVKFHDELNAYRGRAIEESEVPELNRILNGIQDTFMEMHPALNHIVQRNEFAQNCIKDYTNFIDSLRAQGMVKDKEDDSLIVAGA